MAGAEKQEDEVEIRRCFSKCVPVSHTLTSNGQSKSHAQATVREEGPQQGIEQDRGRGKEFGSRGRGGGINTVDHLLCVYCEPGPESGPLHI